MAKYQPAKHRFPSEWGVRIGLAGACALLGYCSLSHALALWLVRSDPERAYALAPFDGRIAARLSEQISGVDATAGDKARADSLASQALRSDPMAVEAVATLGTLSLMRNDAYRANRLFGYSQRLSRREVRTQFWAIENAVAKGDVTGALRYYDIAISTKFETAELLFSVLVSAINDADIRAELVRTLARKPLWGQNFLDYAAVNGASPSLSATLLVEALRARIPVSPKASAGVLERLIESGDGQSAWSYYTVVRKGADRRKSRDPNFVTDLEVPTAFDWVPVDAPGISAAIQRTEQHGLFDFMVAPSIAGPVLRQFQLLPAGSYVLEGHSVGIEQPRGARPYWTLLCSGGRELGRSEIPNSSEADGNFIARFVVPANCPVQVLSLAVSSSNAISGNSGQIDRALLHPVR